MCLGFRACFIMGLFGSSYRWKGAELGGMHSVLGVVGLCSLFYDTRTEYRVSYLT